MLLAGVAIVVAPWTIRNLVVLDRFVPISTGGGQVLFAGTYLPSGGDPLKVGEAVLERHPATPFASAGRPRAPRLEVILAALAAERHPGLDSDVALARMGREQLWHDLTEEPWRYAGFLANKLNLLWLHGPRNVMREPVWTLFHLLLIGRRDRPGGTDRGEAPGGAADRSDPGGDHPDRVGPRRLAAAGPRRRPADRSPGRSRRRLERTRTPPPAPGPRAWPPADRLAWPLVAVLDSTRGWARGIPERYGRRHRRSWR